MPLIWQIHRQPKVNIYCTTLLNGKSTTHLPKALENVQHYCQTKIKAFSEKKNNAGRIISKYILMPYV